MGTVEAQQSSKVNWIHTLLSICSPPLVKSNPNCCHWLTDQATSNNLQAILLFSTSSDWDMDYHQIYVTDPSKNLTWDEHRTASQILAWFVNFVCLPFFYFSYFLFTSPHILNPHTAAILQHLMNQPSPCLSMILSSFTSIPFQLPSAPISPFPSTPHHVVWLSASQFPDQQSLATPANIFVFGSTSISASVLSNMCTISFHRLVQDIPV